MKYSDAMDIVEDLRWKRDLTEDEEERYIEALSYLIQDTNNSRYMVELGGYYYEQKHFDLALKYYEMADLAGDKWAAEGLGYIWYYGRTGEKDYMKAFEYYSKASMNGNINSSLKVADMYKHGYYVEEDYDKYREIIEELYDEYIGNIGDYAHPNGPAPEICSRLAGIRKKEGRTEEAVELLDHTISWLAERIRFNQFFGNVSMMEMAIRELYTMIDIDYEDLNMFDMFEVLTRPVKVSFRMHGEDTEHILEAVDEDGIAIRYDDKWYRSVNELFVKSNLGKEAIHTYDIRVIG